MSFTNTNVIGKNAFAGCFKLTSLEIPHNDNLIIGQAAFAELCGVITLHYTEEEVNNLKKLTGKWYGFDQGFSGILHCIGS